MLLSCHIRSHLNRIYIAQSTFYCTIDIARSHQRRFEEQSQQY